MSSPSQLSRLEEIAQKEEVVDTVQAQQLQRSPREVEQEYRDHLNTHLSLGDTSDIEDQLLTNLDEQTGTLGIIAGKYAYGKTSTSISFWDRCEDAGYVAVPPFVLSSLTDLLDATTGWLKHELGDRYTDRIDELYETYQRKGIEQLADETGKEHDIDPDKVSELIADLNDSGRMNEDMPAEVLVDYYLDATELVEDAGYEGLVVYADEVQQFFKKHSYSNAEEELRSLIWGFKPRNVPFGMMFSVPDEQLAVINERGADILDRVRENNLLLNLTSTYDEHFPEELWTHYAAKYDFEDISGEIIPSETLMAIGQYATREDLSRGPRTVIDAFGYAVTEYLESSSTYTPERFVESYIDNRLRFTEPEQKVRGAVSEAMATDAVRTLEHERAIKLMAAFPNGVPQDVVVTYGLQDAMSDLGSELHGTLLTYYADGYTLVELVAGDPDVTVSGEILRDFWREYQETDEDVADAITAFDEHVLPKLFPRRGRGQSKTGWTVRESNRLHKHTIESYCEGTFDPNYPQRSAYVRVSGRRKDLGKVTSENRLDSDAELQIGFFLDHNHRVDTGLNELEEGASYQFLLDLNESLMKGDLPQRIRKLKDYMNPRSVTPLLMLALTRRIDREIEEGEDNMTLAQEQSLETLRDNLISETIEILFDDELRERAPADIGIRRLRERMVEDLFRDVMRDRYPDYSTLYKGRSITRLIGEYISSLNSDALELALTQKQGRRSSVVTKDALGEAFNVKNHSSLKNKLTNKYADLVDLDWDYEGGTDEVEIKFVLHPLESSILEAFDSDEAGTALARRDAQAVARQQGYTEEEFEQSLRLLTARQYIDEDDGDLVRVETTIDKSDIEETLSDASANLGVLADESATKEDLQSRVTELREELSDTPPEAEEKLENIRERVTQLQRLAEEELTSQFNEKRRALDKLRDKAESLKRTAQRNQLDKIEIPVTFARHLNKQRTSINNRYEHIGDRAEEIETRVDEELTTIDSTSVESYKRLADQYNEESTRLDELNKELETQNDYRDGYQEWRSLAGRVDDLDERVMRFADRTGEREFQNRLDTIQGTINEKFSEQSQALLDQALFYEDKIEGVEKEFNERVGKKREAFQNEREALNTVLRTAADGHPGLRRRFSEASPDESYDLLEEDFFDTFIDDVLGELWSNHDSLSRTVRRADRFQTVPGTIDVDEFQSTLDAIGDELSAIENDVTDWSIDDGAGALEELAAQVEQQRDRLAALENDIEKLNRPVRPDSEELVELYTSLEYGATMQLDDLLETADEDDPEMLAKQLAALFQRNLVNIQVEKRFRDLPDE